MSNTEKGPLEDSEEQIPYNQVPYNSDRLNADRQVTTEEQIAQIIKTYWDEQVAPAIDDNVPGDEGDGFDDEDCNLLGRAILYRVLREFRPDLFVDAPTAG